MSNPTDADVKTLTSSISKTAVVGLIIAIGLFLIGHYALTSWAEASEAHHTVQHVVIFLGGLGMGVSGLSLFKTKK